MDIRGCVLYGSVGLVGNLAREQNEELEPLSVDQFSYIRVIL